MVVTPVKQVSGKCPKERDFAGGKENAPEKIVSFSGAKRSWKGGLAYLADCIESIVSFVDSMSFCASYA